MRSSAVRLASGMASNLDRQAAALECLRSNASAESLVEAVVIFGQAQAAAATGEFVELLGQELIDGLFEVGHLDPLRHVCAHPAITGMAVSLPRFEDVNSSLQAQVVSEIVKLPAFDQTAQQ